MFDILRHRCIPGPSRVLNISQRLKESSFRNKRNLTLTNLTPGLVVNETSNHHQPQRFPWDAPHQSLKAWRLRPWFRCHWLEISLERKVKWLFRLLRRPVIFGVQRVPTRERTQVWHCFTKIIHLESWRSCCIPRLITVFKGPPPSAVPHSFILSDAGKSTLNTNPLCDTEARASCRQRKSARYRGAPKQRLRRTSIWFRSEMILLVLTKTDGIWWTSLWSKTLVQLVKFVL